MKRIKKLLIAIVILSLCTGCTVDYKLEISENQIIEKINVIDKETTNRSKETIYNEYQRWFPVYTDISSTPIEFDVKTKIDGVEYHERNIEETADGYNYEYKYTYPIEKYQNASVLRQMYMKKNIYVGSNYLTINTDDTNLLCNYSYFENINIEISVDPKIYKVNTTNANDITGNTYSWYFNRNNCNNSKIILILDKTEQESEILPTEDDDKVENEQNNQQEKKSEYIMYIVVGILIIIILLGNFMFKKFQEKSNNIDIDD